MNILGNVVYKAKCVCSCEGYIMGTLALGCCAHNFTEGEMYELEMDCYSYVNGYGEVVVEFSATVLTGTVDGYDMPCGLEFINAQTFNQYFRAIAVEVE